MSDVVFEGDISFLVWQPDYRLYSYRAVKPIFFVCKSYCSPDIVPIVREAKHTSAVYFKSGLPDGVTCTLLKTAFSDTPALVAMQI